MKVHVEKMMRTVAVQVGVDKILLKKIIQFKVRFFQLFQFSFYYVCKSVYMLHLFAKILGSKSWMWLIYATLQVKTILVAMATKILELATKLQPKSPVWRLKLRRRIESDSLI